MPCDSIIRNTVDIGKVDPGLLEKAMTDLGVPRDYWRHVGQSVQITSYAGAAWAGVTQDNIKQAYSAQVVKTTAAKMGWQVKQTGAFKYQVIKR